ncbi:MAG: hypothetical protein LBH80_08210 [Prevotellaceae bacterium]|jgi:hypothetical protein|nr:hypothetical protein [Prevotellaceae bacterium]
MKVKIKWLFAAFVITLGTNSCTFNGTDLKADAYFFDVKYTMWTYNGNYGRYECVFDFPELTPKAYEYGTNSAYVFIDERGMNGNVYETQKPLPYSQTVVNFSGQLHTETIGYDCSPSSVCFYIQTSDLKDVLLRDYSFKVTLIYNPEYGTTL